MEGKLWARTWKHKLFHQGGSDLPTGTKAADSVWYLREAVHSLQSLTAAKTPQCCVGQTGSWLPLTRMGEISTCGSSGAT